MVVYECFRCGYIGKQKCHLVQHLNRKNICNHTLENVSIEYIKNYYNFNNTLNMTQKQPKITQNEPKLTNFEQPKKTQNNPFLTQNNPFSTQNNPKYYKCDFCSKLFNRKWHLSRHLNSCKIKQESELVILNKDEEIKKMKLEIEELKKNKGNTNITNNTVNNTININNYGDENLNHLKSKDFANLLNGIYGAVPKLIEKIHFDPEHPENQNIKYTNKKMPYLSVLKNNKWQLVNKKQELLDLIDNKCYLLKEKYYDILEKNKYNITKEQLSKIEEFIDKYHEDDKKVMLDLIERTELMLLNNS